MQSTNITNKKPLKTLTHKTKITFFKCKQATLEFQKFFQLSQTLEIFVVVAIYQL